MRLDGDMIHDEFETYFAEAEQTAAIQQEAAEKQRRGSLPTTTLDLLDPCDHLPRRTASCKYPSVRKRSVRRSSKSPARNSPDQTSLVAAEPSYVHEPTLRAPGPSIDVKCASAPQSRSSSWKNMKRPRSYRDLSSQEEGVPFEDCVTAKLEHLRLLEAEDCCVVRNFSTSSKGIVNRGDSFKRKNRSNSDLTAGASNGSTGSISSTVGKVSPIERNMRMRDRDRRVEELKAAVHKVLMLGDHGVGKSALLQQFMTSEYMGAVDASFDEGFTDACEKTVSVLLDAEETTMDIIDVAYGKEQEHLNLPDVAAYIVVYAMNDRSSFLHAVEILQDIRKVEDKGAAVILVANKSDLVRKRKVNSEEAKGICSSHRSKYIEVSAALNHKVDDLLVGAVTQIRLRPKRLERLRQRREATDDDTAPKSLACMPATKGFLGRLFRKPQLVSRSCDNLLVL
ncbi:hypothetical protein NP493_119g03044 [Ridgeia piscesae]|uniref:Uncharacterized protein n=1 Tax=Ridgeia piscesae TaxID=27915 RepID=A0AAD9P690_RIDPI|nr:hypothetical protein NP493_119g03044 [Ridgeia piscesae]